MRSNILAIIGSGHLGQQIANYAISDSHFDDVVFFDDFTNIKFVNGFKIIGSTDSIIDAYEKKIFSKILIGIGYNHIIARKKFFDQFYGVVPFATIIHSTCWVDKSATVKEGCVLYPGCIIESNVTIEYNTLLNVACSISHDSKIGAHSFLSPRVAIAGFVNAGECCIYGINSIIIDSVDIMKNIRLGAGTVVIKNIDKQGLYVGNPHKFIK